MPNYQFSPFANDQFLDANGNVAVGYKLFTYLAGTTTKEPVYTDVAGVTPHANPIALNSIGRPSSPVFIDITKDYKFVLASPSSGDPPTSPIYTADNVSVRLPATLTLTTRSEERRVGKECGVGCGSEHQNRKASMD